jgi:hypothetical protein
MIERVWNTGFHGALTKWPDAGYRLGSFQRLIAWRDRLLRVSPFDNVASMR